MGNAELDYRTHRTIDMYKHKNDLRGGYKKREETLLKNDDGSLITTYKELTKKWRIYFDNLLNCGEPNKVLSNKLGIVEEQDCLEPYLQEIRF